MKPDFIMAQDYKSNGKRIRPYDTVKPLADKMGLAVDHSCDRDDEDCAADLIKRAAGNGARRILVCWEHKVLSDIAEELGIKKLEYPDDRFDIVFEMYDGEMVNIYSEECPNLDSNYIGWVGTRSSDLLDDDSWAKGRGK